MKAGAAEVIGAPCCTSCVMARLLAAWWSMWIYDKVAVGKIVFQAIQYFQLRKKVFGLTKGNGDNKI
jgi:hypothetical protein